MKIVVASGGFDPIHSGHLFLLNQASELGDKLFVGVNSDEWLQRKKGREFMSFRERSEILNNIKCVDTVFGFDDSDGSACDLLRNLKKDYPEDEIIFVNGGDRTKHNIPEMSVEGVKFVFGVGGENKKNSSSWILQNWSKQHKETRWGYWEVLDDEFTDAKMKKLVVTPGGCLSYQKHAKRSELWFVAQGYGKLIYNESTGIDHLKDMVQPLKQFQNIVIQAGRWHQIINDSRTDNLVIYEIQYGEECVEEDIQRCFSVCNCTGLNEFFYK